MPFDTRRHHRHSIRRPAFDYAGAAAYFVTICTHGRVCLFGEGHDGVIRENAFGRIVREE